jgi:hypothetical protein
VSACAEQGTENSNDSGRCEHSPSSLATMDFAGARALLSVRFRGYPRGRASEKSERAKNRDATARPGFTLTPSSNVTSPQRDTAPNVVNEGFDLSPQSPELELNISRALYPPERCRTGRGIAQAKVRRSETRGYDSTTGPTSECLTAASSKIVSLKRANKD